MLDLSHLSTRARCLFWFLFFGMPVAICVIVYVLEGWIWIR